MNGRVFRNIGTIFMAVLFCLIPLAVSAGSSGKVQEYFIQARFSSTQGCLWFISEVEANEVVSSTPTATVMVRVRVYDNCQELLLIDSTAIQPVALSAVTLDNKVKSGSILATVAVPGPDGVGLDVVIDVSFIGGTSANVTKTSTERLGVVEGEIILPAYCGVILCEDTNLAPELSYFARGVYTETR